MRGEKLSFLKKLRKYKKAGMELSINAIVILIIAMIVLGLGVVFVRGLFVKAGGKLGGAITGAQVSKPASPDEPLTIDPTQLEFSVSRGETSKNVVISVFNTGPEADVALALGECQYTAGSDAVKLLAPKQKVSNNKIGNWNAALTVDTTKLTSGNSAVCTIQATGGTGFTVATTLTLTVSD